MVFPKFANRDRNSQASAQPITVVMPGSHLRTPPATDVA